MTTIEEIASEIHDASNDVQSLIAFNTVRKTRLSGTYKNAIKEQNGTNRGTSTAQSAKTHLSGTMMSKTVRRTSNSLPSRAASTVFTLI